MERGRTEVRGEVDAKGFPYEQRRLRYQIHVAARRPFSLVYRRYAAIGGPCAARVSSRRLRENQQETC